MSHRLVLSLFIIPLSVSLFLGCSGEEETAGPGTETTSDLGSEVEKTLETAVEKLEEKVEQITAPKLDLAYITDDFTSAVIVHPKRMLNSSFMDELIKAGLPLEDVLKEPMGEFGIDPRNVEQITILLDKETAAMAPMLLQFGGPPGGGPDGFGPGEEFEPGVPDTQPEPLEKDVVPENSDQGSITTPLESVQTVAFQPTGGRFGEEGGGEFGPVVPPMPTLIVRFSEEVDANKFLNAPPYEDAEIDGLKVKKPPFPEVVFHFVDSKTLIFTQPDYLKKMVDTKTADSELITELKTVDPSHDLIVVADLMPFRPMLEEASQMLMIFIPPDKAALGSVPVKTKMITLTGGLSHDSLLSINLIMDSENDVTAVNNVLTDGLKQARTLYEQQKAQGLPPDVPLSDADQKTVMQMADEIVAGISNKADGYRLTITIPKPGNFNKLAAMLKPAIDEAKKAAESSQRSNQLKQIGLAFHNYHDVYGALPAAGSDATGEKKGLSWRVHLLPFLDQAPLYEQFHLDEPWDSDHNKALISQMPDVFKTPEVTEEGKTVFHVVVGDNTAFQMEKGLKFRDFTDGLSNTIFAVQAGPDKADIWTKPGGLEFIESEPSETFGTGGADLLILLADGSVHEFSFFTEVDQPGTLKALITRNGGEVIGDF